MKVFNYILGFFLFANLLSSCASVSHVDDDDIYVLKNPALPSGEAVNDETSYENYRFKRDQGNVNSVYTRTNMYRYDVAYVMVGGNFMMYSPFYDAHYYPGYYGNNIMYTGNQYAFHGGFYNDYYNPFYSPYNCYNMYNSWYGNPYYYGNNYNGNVYFPNNNTTYIKPQTISSNFHQGPRNSIAGVNNGRRSSTSGMKGIAVKPSSNVYTQNNGSTTKSVKRMNTPIKSGDTKTVSTSRPVISGTGLSKSGTRVSTSNTNVRHEGSNTQSGTRVSNGNSGNSNSGRSISVESPKSSGGSVSTPTRSGSGSGSGSGSTGGGTVRRPN